ncbi:MAG TPA: ferredoxin reductase [Candidatus Dormibacteraeota bacterium]
MAEPLRWQLATVEAIHEETPHAKTFTFRLPRWTRHRAGQHYDLRLTAPDGYQAERSYSIASEPERGGVVDLTIERIADGEVSAYMHEVVIVGDRLELRGPIGGYFVWEANDETPLLLIGGGSGVVPLMAMVRHRAARGSRLATRLLYSSRSQEDVIYARELQQRADAGDGFELVETLTRSQPAGWTGYRRRIDRPMLEEVIAPLGRSLRAYVCGPTVLVEVVANLLVDLRIPPAQIRTERFGPTGN